MIQPGQAAQASGRQRSRRAADAATRSWKMTAIVAAKGGSRRLAKHLIINRFEFSRLNPPLNRRIYSAPGAP